MPTIQVVAAIIIRNGEVFATQRWYGEWKGWWEFPGKNAHPPITKTLIFNKLKHDIQNAVHIIH